MASNNPQYIVTSAGNELSPQQFIEGTQRKIVFPDGLTYNPTPATPPPAGLPSDVSLALAGVPIAQDGFVITADFHNSLRAALVAIASFLGDAAVNESVSLTLAPAFLGVPGTDTTTWKVIPQRATASDKCAGWMPVGLPDGAQLRTLSVVLTPQKDLTEVTVTLSRMPLEGGSPTTLLSVRHTDGDAKVVTDSATLAVSGITSAAALEDFRRVDNGSYRYFVEAAAIGGDSSVDIHSLQVGYTRW